MTTELPRRGTPPAARRPTALASRDPYPGVPPVLDQLFGSDSLHALRAAAEAHAFEAGMPEGRGADLVIAVHELASNAVWHGAGTGRLQMRNTGRVLHCLITDDGRPQPPGPAGGGAGTAGAAGGDPEISFPEEHGHGLWMVRQLAGQFQARADPAGTIAAVTFALPGSGPWSRLTQHVRDGQAVLKLAGDLDRGSAPRLTAAIRALLADRPSTRLVLDLTAMTWWDSGGLAALITAQQDINASPSATMILTGLPSGFRRRLEVIDVTGQFTLSAPRSPSHPE